MTVVSTNVDRFLYYSAHDELIRLKQLLINQPHLPTADTLPWETLIVLQGKTVCQHTVHARQ